MCALLQAAALAVPIPAGCAGILGRPFLDSFAAAELRYRDKELRFHADFSDAEVAAAELVRVPAGSCPSFLLLVLLCVLPAVSVGSGAEKKKSFRAKKNFNETIRGRRVNKTMFISGGSGEVFKEEFERMN